MNEKKNTNNLTLILKTLALVIFTFETGQYEKLEDGREEEEKE